MSKRTIEGVNEPSNTIEGEKGNIDFNLENDQPLHSKIKLQILELENESSKPIEIKTKSSKKEKKEIMKPPVPSGERQCHFYVSKKGRYCQLNTRLGNKFCGEHSLFEIKGDEEDKLGENESEGKKRIPCPYDPRHTIYETDLEKHLIKCNARPPPEPPVYHNLDINIGPIIQPLESVRLIELPEPQIISFLDNLKEKTNEILPKQFKSDIRDHKVMDNQKVKKLDIKHVAQQGSLIGQMENIGLLNTNNCFVEFGAGKAELSMYVHHALNQIRSKQPENEQRSDPAFLLVDRKNFRLKFDRYLKKDNEIENSIEAKVQRVKIDIKDLDLSKIEMLKNRPIVAYSKHLCGAATDLTLKCLEKFQSNGGKVAGIVIALCCHHVCSAQAYPNLPFLTKEAKILDKSSQFGWLSTVTSWAICGLRAIPTNENNNLITEPIISNNEDNISNNNNNNIDDSNLVQHYSKMSHSDREKLGFNAKRIIDFGRLQYLKKLNYNADLIQYVNQSTSLENIALIGKPKN